LLGILPVKGCIFTSDAAFCQRDFCEKVIEGGGDYVLIVKDNQPGLAIDLAAGLAFEDEKRRQAAALPLRRLLLSETTRISTSARVTIRHFPRQSSPRSRKMQFRREPEARMIPLLKATIKKFPPLRALVRERNELRVRLVAAEARIREERTETSRNGDPEPSADPNAPEKADTDSSATSSAIRCPCCGCDRLQARTVLWKKLIAEWRIAPHEVEYIDRQQGTFCLGCGANLRSMALAAAIMRCLRFDGVFRDFVRGAAASALKILEINEAGHLAPYLRQAPGHMLKAYPEIDMMNLPFAEETFDLIVHSDTLEHVPQPVRGLSECCRVLKTGGFCVFTIPIIVDRLTVSREGLPPSYHGNPTNPLDYLVYTEYGADAWKHVVQAKFSECRLFSLEYPAAQALIGVK
jgi:SAM-dependent methyltransferase